MLKTLEQFHHDLKSTNSDEENQQLIELIQVFHQQLKTSDENFLSTIKTLREIQLNRTKFNDSAEEIRQTIDEQRNFFGQCIENQRTIQPEHLEQQIELMKNLKKQLENKTSSMIENLRQTNKVSSKKNDEILSNFLDENDQFRSDLQVRLFNVRIFTFFGFSLRLETNSSL